MQKVSEISKYPNLPDMCKGIVVAGFSQDGKVWNRLGYYSNFAINFKKTKLIYRFSQLFYFNAQYPILI